MIKLNQQELSQVINSFLQGVNPVLFAGAGVSAHAGLPTWSEYMEHLASYAEKYDSDTATLIRKRAKNGYYLEAASVYKTCPEIPEGEKYNGLSEPFINTPRSENLRALISLPFFAIVTTNYDRSLHHAYADVYRKAPNTVELCDSTISNAPFRHEHYIARIHGRAEVPKDMVVDDENYRRILNDNAYSDYVTHLFTNFSCLFLGFSFADPAISNILTLIENRLSPHFPKLHLALLPSDTKEDLVRKLTKVNIEVKFYDPINSHSSLWESIKLSSRFFQKQLPSGKNIQDINSQSNINLPIEGIKKYIASAYSRLQMAESEGNSLVPLRDIAVDGIIIGMLSSDNEEGQDINDLKDELQKYLHLSQSDTNSLFERRIGALIRRNYVDRIKDKIFLLNYPEENLTAHLSKLVAGVINRYKVREGKTPKPQTFDVINIVIEKVLMIRSWDLGACFAGATNGDIPNVFYTVQDQVEKLASNHSSSEKQALTRAVFNLFTQPENHESELLGDLGRVAFGLQLITNNPCSAYSEVLPQKIYFDANVLMPAIVDGHPFSPVYRDAIYRLRKASENSGTELSLLVIKDFLNEVISHRKLAISEVYARSLHLPNELERYINLHGHDSNVFIMAYSGRVGREKKHIKFEEFLNSIAPYTNEKQLEEYLLKKEGIKTDHIIFSSEEESQRYSEISSILINAYNQDIKPGYYEKQTILIEHEANQIAKLIFDLEKGGNVLFITADQRLRRLASKAISGKLGSSIISHRGLVQLIDLLLGVKSDPTSVARLIWGGGYDDQTIAIYNYLTKKALDYYDEAYSMALPEVLTKMSEKLNSELKTQRIDISSSNPSTQSRTIRFMDRFEDEFYQNMAEALHKYDKGSSVDVNQIRQQYIVERISIIEERIRYLESAASTIENKEIKIEMNNEITEQKHLKSYFQNELKK